MKNRNFELVRKLGDFDVVQRTKDGMFNATELMKQWKQTTGQEKRIQDFLNNQQTKEFIDTLAEDLMNQTVPNTSFSRDLESVENKDVVKSTPKSVVLSDTDNQNIMKQIIQVTRGRNGATWMHPLLFVKYAMWYNPKFELQVLKFVADKLIQFRNDVADSYKDWCAGLAMLGATTPEDFSRIQKCMNYAVFNRHSDGIRDTATPEQLDKMRQLEQQIMLMSEFGYIKNLADVRTYLRKVWEKDYPNPYTEVEVSLAKEVKNHYKK